MFNWPNTCAFVYLQITDHPYAQPVGVSALGPHWSLFHTGPLSFRSHPRKLGPWNLLPRWHWPCIQGLPGSLPQSVLLRINCVTCVHIPETRGKLFGRRMDAVGLHGVGHPHRCSWNPSWHRTADRTQRSGPVFFVPHCSGTVFLKVIEIFFLNRSFIALQCCVFADQQGESAIHMHISPLSPQSIEESSLCYTVGSH